MPIPTPITTSQNQRGKVESLPPILLTAKVWNESSMYKYGQLPNFTVIDYARAQSSEERDKWNIVFTLLFSSAPDMKIGQKEK